MVNKPFTVVRGKRLRLTRTDECGNPPEPAAECAVIVTKGFITVGLTRVSEDGDEITQKNADGDLCVNDRSRDQFRRWDVNMEFCGVNPAALDILTNVVLETDWDDNVVGIRQPEGASVDSFAAELWTGVPGTDCTPGEPTTYGYLLLPFVIGSSLGDITIENGAATFTVDGYTRAPAGWGVGPYDVIPTDADHTPGPLGEAMGASEHLLLRTTTIAPPDPNDDCQAMPEWGGEGEGGG